MLRINPPLPRPSCPNVEGGAVSSQILALCWQTSQINLKLIPTGFKSRLSANQNDERANFRHNGRGELIRLNWSHFARDSHLDAPIEQVTKVAKVHPSQVAKVHPG